VSFDVHLIGSSTSPPAGEFEARVDAALQALDAVGSVESEDICTHDGWGFELYAAGGGGAMFSLRGFSPSIAQIVFAIAEATSCFVLSPDGELKAFRTPSNLGDPPAMEDEGSPVILPVSSDEELARFLAFGFDSWADFRDRAILAADAARRLSTDCLTEETPSTAHPSRKTQSFAARLWARLFGSH